MNKPFNPLTPEEEYVIVHKGTERPFTGEYDKFYEPGTYVCRRCNTPLYYSESKFNSGCGWPAFDDEIAGEVLRLLRVGKGERGGEEEAGERFDHAIQTRAAALTYGCPV